MSYAILLAIIDTVQHNSNPTALIFGELINLFWTLVFYRITYIKITKLIRKDEINSNDSNKE
jgi:hypothetical protein